MHFHKQEYSYSRISSPTPQPPSPPSSCVSIASCLRVSYPNLAISPYLKARRLRRRGPIAPDFLSCVSVASSLRVSAPELGNLPVKTLKKPQKLLKRTHKQPGKHPHHPSPCQPVTVSPCPSAPSPNQNSKIKNQKSKIPLPVPQPRNPVPLPPWTWKPSNLSSAPAAPSAVSRTCRSTRESSNACSTPPAGLPPATT